MAKKKEPNVVELTPQELAGIATAFTTKKNDIINITTEYDNVVINKSKGSDTLNFIGKTSGELKFSRDGKDLIIKRYYAQEINSGIDTVKPFGKGDDITDIPVTLEEREQTVRVSNYFTNNRGTATKSAVKYVTVDNGEGQKTLSLIDDGLISSADIGIEYKRSKKGVIKGTVFNDTILGSTLNDKIKGGKGDDVLYGDVGNDKLYGGKGNDTFVFDTYSKKSPLMDSETMYFGSGKDYVMDGAKGDTLKFNTSRFKDLAFKKEGKNLIITYKDYQAGDDETKDATVVIKNYFKSKNPIDKIIALNEAGTGLTEYSIIGNASIQKTGKGKISGSDSKDIITGSNGKDKIETGLGDDIINAGQSDDTIILTSNKDIFGYYNDKKDIYISNGDGNDTIKNAGNGGYITLYFDSNTTDVTWDRVKGTDNMLVTRTYTDDNEVKHTEETLLEGVYAEGAEATVQYAIYEPGIGYPNIPNEILLNGTEYLRAKDDETVMSGHGLPTVFQLGNHTTTVTGGDHNDYYNTLIPQNRQIVISDSNGRDSISLGDFWDSIYHDPNEMVNVYFEIGADGTTGNDLYLSSADDSNTPWLAERGIKIENYFGDGQIESIKYVWHPVNTYGGMETNWPKFFQTETIQGIVDKMVDWLDLRGYSSTADVFALQQSDPETFTTMYSEMMNIFRGYNYKGDEKINNVWTAENPFLSTWEYDAKEEHTEKYVINSEWGDDELEIKTNEGSTGKHSLFFSVSATGQVGSDLYIDADDSIISAGLNPFSDNVTTGILIENYFTRDGYIENITSQGNTLTSIFLDNMAQDVANWLNTNGYESTDAVFEGGQTEDIAAMLNIYTSDSSTHVWQEPYNGPV